MTGGMLKDWRLSNNLSQADLMLELGINSRQTLVNWEKAKLIPRTVELSIIALDQVEASRRINYGQAQKLKTKIENIRILISMPAIDELF
jgi:transcriptional regulator with XRE-family HTH domain